MITHNRLNDFSSVYKDYKNKLDSDGPNGSNTDGYKFYRFVSSPDAVVLFNFGRVASLDIHEDDAVKKIWNPLPGTNTPDAWKIKLGIDYSESKRNDYSDIESTRIGGKPVKNITSVTPGLQYKMMALININPPPPDPFNAEKSPPPLSPETSKTKTSGPNYVKNMQNDLGITSGSAFLKAVVNQEWLDAFRPFKSIGTTVDFSSYDKLLQPISDETVGSKIETNAIGIEWFGYFKPPDLSVQYSFTLSTSNGGNFLMWLGNAAICEYTPSNADIIFPNVEFTPKTPIREPKYYPIRIQYYANANKPESTKDAVLPRNFSFGIKNLTTKDNLVLSTVLFTINKGTYFPKLQYLAFLSTSIDLFANAALECYTNDITTSENKLSFYNFINSQKFITLKKTNDRARETTNQDQFGIIKENGIFYSHVSEPNDPSSFPVVFSIYRLDVDMRMNKTFQINTEKNSATNSYTMNPVDDGLIKRGSTYTTLTNYYTDNPSAGINATADECKKQCTGLSPDDSTCNWYFAYRSNGVDRCLIDNKNSQPVFNQVRPTGGNTANSSVDDKTSSLNMRNYSFPKYKGCGPNSVLLKESETVLNTQIYTDSFPYSTYIIDPKVISNVNQSGICGNETTLKLFAEAKNILGKDTLYQDDGQYQHSDGTMKFSNYPPYTDTKFWSNVQESFSTTNTNALGDTQNNANLNKAKEQRLQNTNSQINSTYSDLKTNIKNYSKMRTFMENDVNYDLSGNKLLYFRNARKPTLREQNALDSNEGGLTQNSLYILGTITASSLLILAILLGRD